MTEGLGLDRLTLFPDEVDFFALPLDRVVFADRLEAVDLLEVDLEFTDLPEVRSFRLWANADGL